MTEPTGQRPDEPTPTEPTPTEPDPAEPAGGRAPTAAAQAASRARRIGGRPVPTPGAGSPESAAGAAPRRRPSPYPRPDEPAAAPDKAAKAAKSPKQPRPPKQPRAPRAARPPLDPEVFRRRVARTGGVLALVAAVAVAALLGVGLWLSHGVWWAKTSLDARRQEVRSQVLAAAKTCTAALLSFDYRSLDVSEKAGQACSTGQLNKDYTTLMDQTVKKIAPQTKTVQTFQTVKAGVTSVSPDGKQWVVLVYGQEAVTNTSTGGSSGSPSATPSGSASASGSRSPSGSATPSASPSPSGSGGSSSANPGRLDISTASVTLTLVNGHWLLSNMTTTS